MFLLVRIIKLSFVILDYQGIEIRIKNKRKVELAPINGWLLR
jgi:hypothetical protein